MLLKQHQTNKKATFGRFFLCMSKKNRTFVRFWRTEIKKAL